MILLVKAPVPVPSLDLVERLMVGLDAVPHTTPRAVTAAPPSEETFPPLLAVVAAMLLTVVVLRVGVLTVVVKDTWFP